MKYYNHTTDRTIQPQYRAKYLKTKKWFLIILILLIFVVFLLIRAINNYFHEYKNAISSASALREAYYADDYDLPVFDDDGNLGEENNSSVYQLPEPTAVGQVISSNNNPNTVSGAYPFNPYKTINSRFKKLQRQNKDIIGWLRINEEIDQGVVQRDNSYYLKRDYRGYHNSNGSIFLDENCNLSKRPHVYILYGHNMKTGAMFGFLRNYENQNYYHNNAFITYDTIYEDGVFVIFAVCDAPVSIVSRAILQSNNGTDITQLLKSICACSLYHNNINVDDNDQLLILSTCMGDSEKRRIIVARRIRDGEDTEILQKTVNTNTKW